MKKIYWLNLVAAILTAQTQPAPKQPYVFHNAQIVGGGFVPGIVMHPAERGLMYARTDIGGAYRWDSRSSKWIPLVDWVDKNNWNYSGIESIGLDPNDPKRLYLAGGTYIQSWASNGAILRSADRGATFEVTPMPFKMGGNEDGRHAGERLAVDPAHGNILFFGSRTAGLWTSSDYGATWSAVSGFPASASTNNIGLVFVTFDNTRGPDGTAPETIYVGASDPHTGLYSSSDGGATWLPVSGQPTGLLPNHGVIDAKGNLYITYGDQPGPNSMTKGAVWKYNTWTQTWTEITPLKPTANIPLGYGAIALDAQHPGTVMAATMDRWSIGDDIYRSLDGGATWTGVKAQSVRNDSPSPYITQLQSPASSIGWWIGNVSIDPFNSNRVLYTTGATIWGTANATDIDKGNPITWTPVARGLEETAVLDLVSPPSGGASVVSALGDIGGFRHDNLTVSPPGGMFSNPVFSTTSSLDFAELNPSVVVRAGSSNGRRAAVSSDGGTTWTPVATEPAGSQGSGTIAVAADGGNIVWTPQSGASVSVSTDRGATWTASQGISPGVRVIADRVNPSKFYGFDPNKARIVMSTDGGRTFAAQTTKPLVANSPLLRAVPGIEGDLWLVGSNFLYHSTDGGVTMTRITTLDQIDSIGFGKASPAAGSGYPALYMIGTVGGLKAIYRSDDGAATWIQINDAAHQYSTSGVIIGDPKVYGRVYVGNNGRGVIYGDIAAPPTPPHPRR